MGSQLRVITANLLNGAADPDALADLVRETQADVVAVQELGFDQAEALSAVLPHGRLDPAEDYTGMGISLRNPALDLFRVSLPYRDARVAKLDPADWPNLDRPIEIVNMHFAAPTAKPMWKQPILRHGQLRGLLDHIEASPQENRILVGDFNATPIWPVYRRVVAHIDDLVAKHCRGVGTRPKRTWPTWSPIQLLRIDHCFGHGVELQAVQVVQPKGSDHCALVLDLAAK